MTVGRWTAKATGPARRLAVMGSLGVVVLGVLAAGNPVAHGASRPSRVTVKAPPSSEGQLIAIAAVPHSSQVWAVGEIRQGPVENNYFVARRVGGRWRRVKSPNVGRYGSLHTLAISSTGSIWLGGAQQQSHGIQERPAIWRWTGKKFAAAKLPPLFAGAVAVDSMAASSATNVWAVGAIYNAANTSFLTLHWNGKKWSAIAVGGPVSSVSTSGPTNAWAVVESQETSVDTMLHWNGLAWSEDGATPALSSISGTATDSPTLAYAVGSIRNLSSGQSRTVLMRFNGKNWSNAPLAKGLTHIGLAAVTLQGTSAWAVGAHTSFTTDHPVIVHTNGGVWTTQHPPSGKDLELDAVSASSARHAYAAGLFTVGSNQWRTFLDVYNGHGWKGEPSRS